MSSVAHAARFFQKVIFFAGDTGGSFRSLDQLPALSEQRISSEYDKAIVQRVQPDSAAD
jgi:hypothetical protein